MHPVHTRKEALRGYASSFTAGFGRRNIFRRKPVKLFLRGEQLLQKNETKVNLSLAVPTIANRSTSTIPKYLASEEVERILSACDQNTKVGRRNYAILLLLARLGLRAGEVMTLRLDDIEWRKSEITIRGKGQFCDRLPLPSDVGSALAAYIRFDRPQIPIRRVFICMKAPLRGFSHPSTVSTIVQRTLSKAGIDAPIKGAHLLRHSLATCMLRNGASMVEIGQILRHRASNTTEIYAKVDFTGLRSLALQWPSKEDENEILT